jgi:hypothetical protein
MIESSVSQTIRQRREQFFNLDESKQLLIISISLEYDGMSMATIFELIKKLSLKISRQALTDALQELVDRQMVIIDKFRYYHLFSYMRETALSELFRRNLHRTIILPYSFSMRGRFAQPSFEIYSYFDPEDLQQQFRFAIYTGQYAIAEEFFWKAQKVRKFKTLQVQIFITTPLWMQFNATHFEQFSLNTRVHFLILAMLSAQGTAYIDPALHAYALKQLEQGLDSKGWLRYLLAEVALHTGEFETAHSLLDSAPEDISLAARATLALIEGRYDGVDALFDGALAIVQKELGYRSAPLPGLSGVYQVAWLLHQSTPETETKALGLIKGAENGWSIYPSLLELMSVVPHLLKDIAQGHSSTAQNLHLRPLGDGAFPASALEDMLQKFWGSTAKTKLDTTCSADALTTAATYAYHLFAAQMVELLRRSKGKNTSQEAALMRLPDNSFFLVDALVKRERWQIALQTLNQLATHTTTAAPGADSANPRLIWAVSQSEETFYSGYGGFNRGEDEEIIHERYDVEPYEQRQSKQGKWTKGKKLSAKVLVEQGDEIVWLTEQDRTVIRASFKRIASGWQAQAVYTIDTETALKELCGHPLVFWRHDMSRPLELVARHPSLQVIKKNNNQLLQLSPPNPNGKCTCIPQLETTFRLAIYLFTPQQRKAAEVIGEGIEIPPQGSAMVSQTIKNMANHLSVQSDQESLLEGEVIPGTPKPLARFCPAEEGYTVHIGVCPAGDEKTFVPGEGARRYTTQRNGAAVVIERHLQQELVLARNLSATLEQHGEAQAQPFSFFIKEGEPLLHLLSALDSMEDEVIIEWPDTQRPTVQRADVIHVHTSIKKQRDWFELQGSVEIDEKLHLSLERLLKLSAEFGGNFIRLDKNSYLELTDRLRRRLDAIGANTFAQGSQLRLGPAAALQSESLLKNLGSTKVSAQWRKRTEAISQALSAVHELPPTLQAQLRDYQVEGYQWLARLSAAGFGACLADDMGLGKTMQSLALLLLRAPQGPALIIAPTSVCTSWEMEAGRFAPTLTIARLHEAERESVIENAGPFDIVLCSYGLLISEQQRLCNRTWTTVILDEAQAIKNIGAKRSRIAMQLQADFRLATTGTPVENHLGELWSIMNFVNPGLLGTLKQFQHRFQMPIEQKQNPAMSKTLKQIISPFVLRRLKSEVLAELPPKTEIVLDIELSQQERTLYEALRTHALKQLSGMSGPKGQQRIKVLAHIMQLRRSCCHPSFVPGGATIDSSKMEIFEQKITELVENNHRALVFSQFTDLLALIRERLEALGIAYHYLDGSTPLKKREQAINAFRCGESPVFLISLKAGGFGLNLTGADYVFIMDPWWNPAVEDQAADRAHRIGQQRPVTVYRFVARNTIEEKIIRLHTEKRELAQSILDGSDTPRRVNVDELIDLIAH